VAVLRKKPLTDCPPSNCRLAHSVLSIQSHCLSNSIDFSGGTGGKETVECRFVAWCEAEADGAVPVIAGDGGAVVFFGTDDDEVSLVVTVGRLGRAAGSGSPPTAGAGARGGAGSALSGGNATVGFEKDDDFVGLDDDNDPPPSAFGGESTPIIPPPPPGEDSCICCCLFGELLLLVEEAE